jgi:hypothetical protein
MASDKSGPTSDQGSHKNDCMKIAVERQTYLIDSIGYWTVSTDSAPEVFRRGGNLGNI